MTEDVGGTSCTVHFVTYKPASAYRHSTLSMHLRYLRVNFKTSCENQKGRTGEGLSTTAWPQCANYKNSRTE